MLSQIISFGVIARRARVDSSGRVRYQSQAATAAADAVPIRGEWRSWVFYKHLKCKASGRGETGRRKGLKIPRLRSYGFDSRRPHHLFRKRRVPSRRRSATRSDEAILETKVPAADIDSNLTTHIFPLVGSLYERFGVAVLPLRVQAGYHDCRHYFSFST
jgi:hypothetical protein